MDIRELTKKYFSGELDVQTLAKEARESMTAKGMVKTRLLGWVHQKELQRLVDQKIVRKSDDDYAYATMWIDEHIITKGGQNKSTGQRIRVLTHNALGYL